MNSPLKRRFSSLARKLAPLLCAVALTGCMGPSVTSLGTKADGTYSRQLAADRINMLSRALGLFYDRVGPVIANDTTTVSLLLDLAGDYVFTRDEAQRNATLERINGLLEDDDKLVAELMVPLSQPKSKRNGNTDGTFLGQWGIQQTDELLEAYIRSQIVDVRGKEPSVESRKWIRLLFHTFYADDSPALVDILPLIDPTRDIVTPGLGS
ncbi:hypothetical protein [Gellertiella hungarica]|uniref:Uncharacterized protein n=1 Tax=Gellertiella hungarica TaxID=1572859 RepID=A0A7W6J3L5_9HYPH|nr:hypothetical protein [Gellertiella hungarica]MBB4064186.1 hypothetical protein [Gellertiella hungarica]